MGKENLSIFIMLILLFSIAGCGSPSAKTGRQAESSRIESSQMESGTAQSSEQPQNSAVPSSENAASSGAAVQSGKPGSSSPVLQSSSQTQPEMFKQIKSALHTEVPVMLPTGVPVGKDRSLTATTASQPADYKVNLYETVQPAEINSQAASKGTLLATAGGTAYPDAKNAAENLPGYMQVNVSQCEKPVDLGHHIEAVTNAGAGHQQLIWNEGRWCITLDSPTDPALRNKKYPDREQLAKDIVAYLEVAMLPAPQKIGVIEIGDWDGNRVDNATDIQWQQNQIVYRVSSPDPMTALKVAVAMQ